MTRKTSTKELIQRSYSFEIRAGEEDGRGKLIEGRPIVYDSMTDLGYIYEVIEKGALDEADLTDVRFLVNHDLSMIPLARSRKNSEKSTMQLLTDELGMRTKTYLDTEHNTDARKLYSAVGRGDITGMSFLFSIDDQLWENLDTEKRTRRIKKISSVIEVSAVTMPAYEDTEIYARDNDNLERLRSELESARKSAGIMLESDTRSKLDFKTRSLLKMYGGK